VLTATSSNGKTATCTVDLYDLHGIAMQARTDLGLGDSTARTVTHSATGTTGPVVCAYMFPDMVVNPAFLRSDGYTSNYDLTFTDYSGANGWVYNGSTSNIYWSGLQQGLSYCTGKVAVTNSPLAIVIPTLYEYTPVRRGGTIFFFDDIIGDDANTTVYTNNGGSAWELSSTGWSCVTHKYWQ
jgi:hypothetical protein